MSIPHVIHRLWLGPRPMPQRFRYYGRDWERLNPGWECHDWSWHDLPEDLANADIMDDTRAAAPAVTDRACYRARRHHRLRAGSQVRRDLRQHRHAARPAPPT